METWRRTLEQVKDFIHKNTAIIILAVLSVLSICLFFCFRNWVPDEYLVISHNDASKNGGPISILNLKNGKVEKPQVSGVGCTTKRLDSKSNDLLVYCLGSQDSNSLWEIQNKDKSVVPAPPLPEPYTTVGVSRHPIVLIHSQNGTRYFNSGGPGFIENGDVTDAGVVIVEGDTTHKVLISDRTQTYFILKMVLDEAENKLWVMSSGNGMTVLIDRIDLNEKRIDFSSTIESYSGFDMALTGKDVAVSAYRTNNGADILFFNRKTAEKKEITLPVREILGFNALAMLERQGRFYVSSMDGLYVFNPQTYEIMEFIENNTGSQFTYLVNGEDSLYAIDAYHRVYRIHDTDRLHPELLTDAEGQGLSSVYYFINK